MSKAKPEQGKKADGGKAEAKGKTEAPKAAAAKQAKPSVVRLRDKYRSEVISRR
jgi:hypothetical protein